MTRGNCLLRFFYFFFQLIFFLCVEFSTLSTDFTVTSLSFHSVSAVFLRAYFFSYHFYTHSFQLLIMIEFGLMREGEDVKEENEKNEN